MPPLAAIFAWLSLSIARCHMAAAAFSLPPGVPFSHNLINGGMPPESLIVTSTSSPPGMGGSCWALCLVANFLTNEGFTSPKGPSRASNCSALSLPDPKAPSNSDGGIPDGGISEGGASSECLCARSMLLASSRMQSILPAASAIMSMDGNMSREDSRERPPSLRIAIFCFSFSRRASTAPLASSARAAAAKYFAMGVPSFTRATKSMIELLLTMTRWFSAVVARYHIVAAACS